MDLLSTVISLFVLLFAITVHEVSHGWAAWKLGDQTAYNLGRVTLNPLAHIDPIGTIVLPLLMIILRGPVFGWAKPVPVNPLNLRHPKQDYLWISLAGPASNLAVAGGSLIILTMLKIIHSPITDFLRSYLINRQRFPQGFFPLEGLALILFYAVLINTYLAVFNLIPVPPLDGSGILSGLLSDRAAARYRLIQPFGFIIVLILIAAGFLEIIIKPIQIVILTLVFF